MEESWRALEINFAYISLSLVTELSLALSDLISLMPSAAYAELLTKFKKVNLSQFMLISEKISAKY